MFNSRLFDKKKTKIRIMSARNKFTTKSDSDSTKIDYLSEDPLIRQQQVCIMSFVGPNLNQKCKINAFKVRGSYENQDDAERKMKELHNLEPEFDMFLAPVGIWCPFNPNPNDIDSQNYGNDQLNELMKGYHENRMRTNQHYNERKRKMIDDAIKEGTQEGQKELSQIKEHPIAVKQRMSDLTEQLEVARENIKKLETQQTETQTKLDKDYSSEELEIAEKEYAEYKKRVSEAESKDELSEIQEELRVKYTEYEKLHNPSLYPENPPENLPENPSENPSENPTRNTSEDLKTLSGDDPWSQSRNNSDNKSGETSGEKSGDKEMRVL